MTKQINQDIDAVKEDFFKGLTFRECIFGGSAFVIGVGGILALVYFFQMYLNLAITLCIPVMGIIGLCGFYEKNGMSLATIIRKRIGLWKQKPFLYATGASEQTGVSEWKQENNVKKPLLVKWLDRLEDKRNG